MQLVPAAAYVRMSTEDQQYSIEQQSIAIQHYANEHGFELVKTYTDAGKSGLEIWHRPGLLKLLKDVVGGQHAFEAILVYDVSRWGRFQDSDEAAHYEFLCTHASVPVHYCAEPFINNSDASNALVKSLKRTMAAEFSRELGLRVFEQKSRLARLGFHMGGQPAYGFRRMLVSANGRFKTELRTGEMKSVSTDRVVLVPGPKREVECVRRMYSLAAGGIRPTAIVRELNEEGYVTRRGRAWDVNTLLVVLTNPKYTGCNVWGRTCQKLHRPTTRVSADAWSIKAHAFPSLVNQRTFERAQIALRNNTAHKPDQELLDRLTRFLNRKGRLTIDLIDKARCLPGATTYRTRFGSFRRLYQLIGYNRPSQFFARVDRSKLTVAARDRVIARLVTLFPEHVEVTQRNQCNKPALRVDDSCDVGVKICQSRVFSSNQRQWVLYPGIAREQTHVTLLCLLNGTNDEVEHYFLFRSLGRVGPFKFKLEHPWLNESVHLADLEDFYRGFNGLKHQLNGIVTSTQ